MPTFKVTDPKTGKTLRLTSQDNTPPTEQELEEVFSKSQDLTSVAKKPERKPARLTLPQRAKFAFGDEPGRRRFLEKAFPGREVTELPTGKLGIEGEPVELGASLTDIPGDIIDISDEIVRLSGQITGATLGASGGVLGIIAGGAAGRAAGQVGVEAIGRTFGLRENELIDVAREIRNEGLVGAAGEAGGIAFRGVSKTGAKFLRNFFNKVQNKVSKPTVQNLFNFTAGIEKSSIVRVQDKGVNNILTRENMSDEAALNVVNKIQAGVKESRTLLGGAVKKAKDNLRNSNVRIDIRELTRNFLRELKDADILDKTFQPKPSLGLGTDTTRNELIKIKDILLKERGNKITAKMAIRIKDELDDLVKFGKEGKLTVGTNEDRIIKQVIGGLNRELKKSSPEFREALQQFSNIAGLEESLKSALSLPKGENTILNIFRRDAFTRQLIERLNTILPNKSKFIEKLKDVTAAQDFSSGTFRGIRSGIFERAFRNITTLGGTGLALGGPMGGLTGLATGIAVSTPRTIGQLLSVQQAVGKGIEQGVTEIGKAAGSVSAPIISNLINMIRKGKTDEEIEEEIK